MRAKQGIAELSFQLAAELALGTYTIRVVNPKASSTFKVEKRGKMEYGEQRMGWNIFLASICIAIWSQMRSIQIYLLRSGIKHKSVEQGLGNIKIPNEHEGDCPGDSCRRSLLTTGLAQSENTLKTFVKLLLCWGERKGDSFFGLPVSHSSLTFAS